MEFNFYEGMKYGKFEKIPLASQGWLNRGSNGDFFSLYEGYMSPNDAHFGHVRLPSSISDILSSPDDKSSVSGFSLLKIEEDLVQKLNKMNITRPADIQIAAMPHILAGKNCVVSAHTGCGKTLAYLLPLLQMVSKNVQKEGGVGVPHDSPKLLIVTPSRELAYQIHDVIQKLVVGLPLTSKLFVGGYSDQGSDDLPQIVDIVVGSLGTIKKKIAKGNINLQRIQHIVMDEADQLVDDQNRGQIRGILKKVSIKQVSDDGSDSEHDDQGTQLILVSATIPTNLEDLFDNMVDVGSLERITTSYIHDVMRNTPQLFLKVGKIHKGKTLIDLIEKDVKHNNPVLIFSNTVKTADWVSYQLNDCGYPCKNLTSSVDTQIRQHLFERFQQKKFNILSTTPIVARGLDTVRVKHIINFDFPLYVSEYIHQIGRVGRIGSSGSCHITNIIAHPREVALVQKIEKSIRLNEKLTAVNANIPGIVRHRREKLEGVEM
ncbi:probable ATP-dependent RNA helicase DDX28 isoform X1 [Thrips palmi]|nr:probable ATP-dependent RNA helicase DDX28 isoform X1 [Thrips palmi]